MEFKLSVVELIICSLTILPISITFFLCFLFLSFNLNPSQKIVLIKIKKNQSSLENEKIGAEFFNFTKTNSFYKISFFEQNILQIKSNSKFFFDG